jgi:hypothetical protein
MISVLCLCEQYITVKIIVTFNVLVNKLKELLILIGHENNN